MILKKNTKYKKNIKLLIATSAFAKNNPNLLKLFGKKKLEKRWNYLL